MPAERRAQFRFPNVPVPEFPNALNSEFTNTPNVEFLNVPACSAPMSYIAGSKWGRPLCFRHAAAHWCLQRWTGLSHPYLRYGDRGRLQNVSPPSVLLESSRIFLQYTADTDAKKNDGPEFLNLYSVIFENFLKFQKGFARSLCGRWGPLQPRPN